MIYGTNLLSLNESKTTLSSITIYFMCMFQMNFRAVSVLLCNSPSIYIKPILDHCNMVIVILPLPFNFSRSLMAVVLHYWSVWFIKPTVWYSYCLCCVIPLIKKRKTSLGIQPEPHYCTSRYTADDAELFPQMFAEITFMVTAQRSTP